MCYLIWLHDHVLNLLLICLWLSLPLLWTGEQQTDSNFYYFCWLISQVQDSVLNKTTDDIFIYICIAVYINQFLHSFKLNKLTENHKSFVHLLSFAATVHWLLPGKNGHRVSLETWEHLVGVNDCYHEKTGQREWLIVTMETLVRVCHWLLPSGVTDCYLDITGQTGWIIITIETCNACAIFDENSRQPYQSGQSRLSQTRKSDRVMA